MNDLQNCLNNIEKETNDMVKTRIKLAREWVDLLDGIAEEQWDRDQFKKTVLKTYEYFKSLYARCDLLENHHSRLPLAGLELEIISMVYAYGRAESFGFIPIEDNYECYASHFIALALYGAITTCNMRPGKNQEFYTVIDQFPHCSPDGEWFVFEYNVKTGDMTEIVNIVKRFVESGWLR